MKIPFEYLKVVPFAYARALNSVHGLIRTPKTLMDKPSKTLDNIKQFYADSVASGWTVQTLMNEGVKIYTVDWCYEKFGSKAIPFNIVVSESTRNKILAQLGKPMTETLDDVNRLALLYFEQIKDMNHDVAVELVASGMFGGNMKVKQKILKLLEDKKWKN